MNESSMHTDRRAKKETLLFEAALDIFAERGFREAGIEDIAKRAGIANGTVYLYAASKRDLYRKVVEYSLNAWQEAAARAAEAVGDTPRQARARFEALCRTAFSYLASESRLRKVLIRDPALFPISTGSSHGEDPFETVNRRSVAMLEQAIINGVNSGEFSVDDPKAAAELLFSLYRMLIEKTYVTKDGQEQMQFEAGLSIILNGIIAHRS
jgi:AcrR family transcriptional regulator